MTEPHWTSYVTAIGAIAAPLLVTIVGILGWRFRLDYQRRLELEEKLRSNRVDIYNQILEPFIIMFMSDAAWKSDPKHKNKDKFEVGLGKALSLDYRKNAFQLALIGSDDVVVAYNDLMQEMYSRGEQPTDEEYGRTLMGLIGDLLLAIRRSMGNEATNIDRWGMLEWFITDARFYRDT